MGFFSKFKRKNFDDDFDDEEDVEDEEEADLALDGNNIELKVIKPKSIEQILSVIDNIRSGRTILLNLEGVDKDLYRRMIDIVSGATYALNAVIKKATNDSYFIAPSGVDVNGEVFNSDADDEEFSDI
jgi:FtsZ-interacting cell division protein YlmF